jgi:hypothetical protein
MSRELIGTALILMVMISALNIYRKVRLTRAAQEAELPKPASAVAGEPIFSGFYVATVFADKPLERVWAFGLGSRGRATVSAAGNGLSVQRIGEQGFQIPRSDIVKVGRARATIDRAVEKDGLIQIGWRLGGTELLSSFRVTKDQDQCFKQLKQAAGVDSE